MGTTFCLGTAEANLLVGDKANLNEFLETFVDFGEQGAGG